MNSSTLEYFTGNVDCSMATQEETKMLTPWSLHGVRLPILTLLYLQATQGLQPLDSLSCVNNFKTHWICHWKEILEERKILPMNLYHWNNLNSSFRHRCNPVDSQYQEGGKVQMSCQFNERFSSSINTSFSFIPEWDVHAESCILPASKVRLPPPKTLKIRKSDNGKISLTWKMPKNVHSSASLLYQVTYYRKDWETLEVQYSEQHFYIFTDHKVIVQNLNCEYDGSTDMRCSWEVRRELINSLSFTLYYTESPADCDNISSISKSSHDKKNLCVGEINEIENSAPYVQYSCTLQVSSSQANNFIRIHVGTREEVKSFKASDNIQIESPTNLQIKDPSKNGYTLQWNPPAVDFHTIQLTYQLCYWKEGDPECPAHSIVNVSGNLPEYYFPFSKLESSTYYTAKVRAKPDEKSLYNGPWSVWSQSWSWKTTIVLSTKLICISAFIISAIVSVFAFFALRYYKRWRQRLDDSLPNPRKSKLLSSHPLGYWKQSFYPFMHHRAFFYAEEEEPSICVPVSQLAPQSTPESAELVTEKAPNPDVCPLGPYALPPPAEDKIMPEQNKCESLDTGEKSDITTVPISEVMKGLSKKSYNGPYLMFSGGQAMSNLVPNEAKHPGYFSLPICQAELPNLPKEPTPSCQPQSSGDQMGYVVSMEKPFSVPPIQNQEKKCVPESKYLDIPAPSDFQISPEGPLIMINPDGSGPLFLKQVGDYCFFPGLRGSQENLERKMTPSTEQNQQKVMEDSPLPAVQAFKVMQRGYLALPHT
ncbi:cytokine receptor common subunit beta [Pyxicephalus adspersus]|uniref:cytokine receptor common subunit beta n=1 Tax=Pyxicephalus adspersus TaxID=30357 RepID=UPI003B5A32C9